jgi:quinol monooxygenase YgiN
MAGFVQIIEFDTSRIDEVRALADEFQSRREAGTVRRAGVTADRDHPGHYLTVVEFDSYDSAMENSRRPDTAEFSARMAQLCDGPPTFHNLDVLESWHS